MSIGFYAFYAKTWSSAATADEITFFAKFELIQSMVLLKDGVQKVLEKFYFVLG